MILTQTLQKDQLLKRIIIGVLIAHVVVFCWTTFAFWYTPAARPARHMVVRTVKLAPAQPAPQPVAQPKKPKAPAKKKEEPKPKPKPKPEPKKKTIKKKELLSKMQENLRKLKKSSTAVAAPLPKSIEKLQVDALPSTAHAELTTEEASYRDLLAAQLQMLLRLPEEGEVKVKLTVERSGQIAALSIIDAKSGPNRLYVEKTLPAVTLPRFGSHFGNQSQYTFLVTLTS